MKRVFYHLLLLFLPILPIHAAVLSDLPGPMSQGGMIHLYTTFTNSETGTFFVAFDVPHSPLEMKPLDLWSPGDTLDPVHPWYSELDPTQGAGMFNSRYGFWVNAAQSDLLPAGLSIGVRLVSSTPGLEIYYNRSSASGALFDPLFSSEHDYFLWNGTMFHPVFVADAVGTYSATFEFFVANSEGNGVVDYTTVAGQAPGYSSTLFTVTLNAVPEPGTAVLFGMALAVVGVARRSRRIPGGER